ncbi:hypothetical protein D3C86_701440 [compost metagenome]
MSATYYSLFLISKNKDEAKAEKYKNKILKDYPNSVYAKTILDPSFSIKQTEMETAINKQYNDIFDQYQKKDFNGVIQRVDEAQKTNGENYLSPQYAYLKAISIGRTNPIDPLLTALNGITTAFPDDRLIIPLVKDHIAYINAHMADFQKRRIALPDFDPAESPFKTAQAYTPTPVQQPVSTTVPTVAPTPAVVQPPLPVTKTEEITTVKPTENMIAPANAEKPTTPAPVKVESIFSTAVSKEYYFVIDVADASLTLSSSRFGIGQFNRGNYAGSNLKHQLKEFDNDQLVYVGNFSNFDDAKAYASGITPQLKQIMKVPANIYSSFIISKENFDKLTSKDLINKYLVFYKNNY